MTGSLIVSWYTVTSFRGTKNEFWVQALPAAQDDTLIFYEAKNRGVKQLIFAVQTARNGSAARRRGVR